MNSRAWWPVLTALFLVGFCWWLAVRNHEQGKNGPDVPLGIYPPGETHVPSMSAERFNISVAVAPGTHPQQIDPIADRRLGLEVVPWDGLVICIEDHQPLTRTVAKALAEHLTGHIASHSSARDTIIEQQRAAAMVIMLPAGESMKLPFPVRRVLRVATESPDAVAFDNLEIGQATDMQFRISMHDALVPSLRTLSGVAPEAGIHEQSWIVSVQVPASDDPDTVWPRWHATVGRSAAAAVITELIGSGGPEVTWSGPLNPRQAASRRHNHALSGIPGWTGTIGIPPSSGVERWHGVVQTPLLRGWTGAIVGLRVPDVKKGVELKTIDVLADILGTEKWHEPEIDSESGQYLWRGTDAGDFDRLVATPRPWGWVVAAYQVHPQAGAIFSGWIDAADTDSVARAHLRQHLHAALFSDDMRAQAFEALRAQPDVADLSVLGVQPGALKAEQHVAQVAAWVRGISHQDTPPVLPDSLAPMTDESDWDGQPALLKLGEGTLRIQVPIQVPIQVAGQALGEGGAGSAQHSDSPSAWWQRSAGSAASFTIAVPASDTPVQAPLP